jgi:hypothetical protein
VLVPPAVVTVISVAPTEPAGEVAVICVSELTVKLVAMVEPNFRVVAPVKSVPVITTEVPPAARPLVGDIAVIVGTATYVNWSALLVTLVPPAVVTVTSIAPALPVGVIAVIEVAELTVKLLAATEPNFTDVAPLKSVPVMVTEVPPSVLPPVGEMELTVGAGMTENFITVALLLLPQSV